MNDLLNRIALNQLLIRRREVLSVVASVGGLALAPAARSMRFGHSPMDEEISRTAEAIHQETVFKADRKRVYDALTDADQFSKVTQLSAAAKSGMALGSDATKISREPGGPFALFGGYISGRQIELVANERIVQAWRVGSWDAGVYSIAKFSLSEQGSDTKLIFDHTGFPVGKADHLADGWKVNYWEPLAKFLAS